MMRDDKQHRMRTLLLAAALLSVVGAIYAFTFFKMGVWLPALR